jgi:hypothetical protein
MEKRTRPSGGREDARQPQRQPSLVSKRPEAASEHPSVALSDAGLKTVQALSEDATTNDVRNYLSQGFGMTVRPNHLGIALQRHRRAGRLENRDQRWYLAPSVWTGH